MTDPVFKGGHYLRKYGILNLSFKIHASFIMTQLPTAKIFSRLISQFNFVLLAKHCIFYTGNLKQHGLCGTDICFSSHIKRCSCLMFCIKMAKNVLKP